MTSPDDVIFLKFSEIHGQYFPLSNFKKKDTLVFSSLSSIRLGLSPKGLVKRKRPNSTYKSKYYIVRKLNNTFRLIDDITTLNSDGYLEEYFKLIYPDSLTLNKENEVDSAAYVLDLDISINVEGKFSCKVYDKRDNFGFKVVKFQPLMSNQASSVLYGTYYSQLVRYSRICNDVDAFSDRVLKFTDDLINLGFKRDRLCNIYLSVVRRYRLKEKFGIVCGNILLP